MVSFSENYAGSEKGKEHLQNGEIVYDQNCDAENTLSPGKSLIDSVVQKYTNGTLWIHCASVGEFEQARPVIEGYRERNPADKIIVTFFSPSGYELRKNYQLADKVFYLPMDTARNARRFIDAVKPTAAVFIKYEFWRNYLNVLKQERIPVYLVSGIFRADQRFFKWWGGSFRKVLTAFTYFFVQDENSQELLNSIGFSNVTISGDTRFDRVYKIAAESIEVEIVRDFTADGEVPVIIVGSSWPADEGIISEYYSNLPAAKIIIAPHEIGTKHLDRLIELFGKERCLRYTEVVNGKTQHNGGVLYNNAAENSYAGKECYSEQDTADSRDIVRDGYMAQEGGATMDDPGQNETTQEIGNMQSISGDRRCCEAGIFFLIIDTIGILSSIYKYGSVAYIGGGFGAGIHNVLEAAVYGIPVVFGPKYQKFKEAHDLIALGGAFSVSNGEEYRTIMDRLLSDEQFRKESGAICKKYVEDNLGATAKILDQI